MGDLLRRGLRDSEAAQILGLHVQTLRNFRCRGEGPPYVKIGRAVRYFEGDLIAYLDKRKIEPKQMHA